MSSLDKFLRIAVVVATLGVIGLSAPNLITQPVSTWAALSLSGFLILLAGATLWVWKKPEILFGHISALFSALVIGRLFSTMRLEAAGSEALSSLDPLLVAETGPGIDSIKYASVVLVAVIVAQILRLAWRQSHGETQQDYIGRPSATEWGMTFLRLYVGLMFIAHFAGHLFAGGAPFGVFVEYFGSIGLPNPTAFVLLAGVIELAVAVGLAFGFMTRIAAIGAAIYLFVSVGLGGHYGVGYVWVLPAGGWEFPALWIFATSLFAMTGAGPASIDNWLKTRALNLPKFARAAIV